MTVTSVACAACPRGWTVEVEHRTVAGLAVVQAALTREPCEECGGRVHLTGQYGVLPMGT